MIFNIIYLFITSILIKLSKCAVTVTATADNHTGLETVFLNVIFRHGDRTPDSGGGEFYPNDPYINYDFNPMGSGGLTNAGKLREYKLGSVLRDEYNEFLGETYLPGILMGLSTNYERTKMSLMVVLSALYPPKDKQIWNDHLKWQPIPINYLDAKDDILMASDWCPQYIEEFTKVKNLKDVQSQIDVFNPLMKNLTYWTGKNITSTNDVFNLYHTLMAEQSMNLKLPEWTNNIFPNGEMRDATILEYKITSYNTKLRKLFGGTLLRNITDTMINITENKFDNRRKINLFSGHETNIASFLLTLGVYEPHVPQYTSGIIVELLRDKSYNYFVGLRHYLGIPSEIKVLQLPGCDINCPINKFTQLLKSVIPTDEDMNCPR